MAGASYQLTGGAGGAKPRRAVTRRPLTGSIPAPKQRAPTYTQPYLPAPIQRAPTQPYIPPAPVNYAPQQVYQPANFAPANFAPQAAAAPAPPPEPPKPSWSMANSNKEIGQVDSTFRDQEAAFNEALQKYIADYNADKSGVERDSKTALEGIGRNRQIGLTGVQEDFAARGLSNSGLRVDAWKKGNQQYDSQEQNIETSKTDNIRRLDFGKGKYEAETKAKVQEAKRDALARLAASQSL